MSSVRYRELDTDYRLGWCVQVDSRGRTTVFHGPWVETFPASLVEGAWAGTFGPTEFSRAQILLGSGAYDLDEDPVFCSASHPYEPLYSVRESESLVAVSNSLPFVCAVTGRSPLIEYPFYVQDISSFTRGLSRATSDVPLTDGMTLRIHRCSSLELSPSLEVTEKRRSPLPAVDSFQEYRGLLAEMSEAIVDNANSADREYRYRPLATVSSGYDSPAAAVLAREAGAEKAVTFGSARPTFGPGSDAGDRIARHLGLEVTEHGRFEYRSCDDFPEADFLAAGTGGEDVVFASLENELSGSILFTGFSGDSLWSRLSADPEGSLDYATGDRSGASLHGFRLRTGFVHFPVPLSTYTQHPSLHEISNSPEMRPWSVSDWTGSWRDILLGRAGPSYDRPIARRIVEEEGVPRELFGQTKRAVSQPFYQEDDLEEIMSPRSLEHFREFIEESDAPSEAGRALASRLLPPIYRLLSSPLKVARKVSRLLGRPRRLELPWPEHYRKAVTERQFTFHWAVEIVKRRFRNALGYEGHERIEPESVPPEP